MPVTNPQQRPDDRVGSLDYPNTADSATPSFPSAEEIVRSEIDAREAISFPEFLEIALYDPNSGYYARKTSQVGRGGDFYTSVSVGPLFGQLLARRFLKWWQETGRPDAWRILEIGAHDGKLAADILATIAKLEPSAWNSLEYAIVDPLPALREAQRQRLENLASKLTLTENTEALSKNCLPGIAFGNEVLDALPFHLVRRVDGAWKELFVKSGLELTPRDIDPASVLANKLEAIGHEFPEGYQTEIRTSVGSFLDEIRSCISDGLMIFIDYGFAAPEYYDTQRTCGTLRTYSKHQAAEDPLHHIGEIDITAHVDFTDLANEAIALGFTPTHFSTQGSYLTHLAAGMIKSGELDDRKSISQFQSLTHPAHLGTSFHVIEFSQNATCPPTVSHRLAL